MDCGDCGDLRELEDLGYLKDLLDFALGLVFCASCLFVFGANGDDNCDEDLGCNDPIECVLVNAWAANISDNIYSLSLN